MPSVPPFDDGAAKAARSYQTTLTKPPGSLGRLEELAIAYAGQRGRFPVAPPSLVEVWIFAADHGVAAEGVSAYPSAVTPAMVANFLSGGAAISVMAREHGFALGIADVGVAGPIPPAPRREEVRFLDARVRQGTRNFRREPALSRVEAAAALEVGLRVAREATERGAELLVGGEMGIGNTTAAAALVSAIGGDDPAKIVGAGTGLDEAGVAHKATVVREALALHKPDPKDPLSLLAAVGGLEIAALSGFMVGAASRRVPVVVDGFICTAAALVAVLIAPAVKAYLVPSHLSAERGHRRGCELLGIAPLFDLGLRLGEGTGGALGAHLLRTAVALQAGMATFSAAAVPDREPPVR
jgi:nicotinate-nucleotide--dimethylbenzimidazole phosphoribosyltransferase